MQSDFFLPRGHQLEPMALHSQISFKEIDHEIIPSVILSLLLTQVGQLVAADESMGTKY